MRHAIHTTTTWWDRFHTWLPLGYNLIRQTHTWLPLGYCVMVPHSWLLLGYCLMKQVHSWLQPGYYYLMTPAHTWLPLDLYLMLTHTWLPLGYLLPVCLTHTWLPLGLFLTSHSSCKTSSSVRFTVPNGFRISCIPDKKVNMQSWYRQEKLRYVPDNKLKVYKITIDKQKE